MSVDASAAPAVRRWLVALMLLSLFGVADSGYLLQRHARGGSGFCPAYGCDIVNQGEYAEVKGIPVAAIGLAGYATLLGLSVLAAALRARSVVKMISVLSGIGVVVSAYLTYFQVAVIAAICFWCVISTFTIASIFPLSIVSLRKMRPLDRPYG